MVQLLLKGGAELNKRTTNGYTALYLASRFGQKEVVALLLDRGAEGSFWRPTESWKLW